VSGILLARAFARDTLEGPWATRYSSAKSIHCCCSGGLINRCAGRREGNRALAFYTSMFKPVLAFSAGGWVLIASRHTGQLPHHRYTPGRLCPVISAGWCSDWRTARFTATSPVRLAVDGTGHTGCQRLLHCGTGGHAPGLPEANPGPVADSIVGDYFPVQYYWVGIPCTCRWPNGLAA